MIILCWVEEDICWKHL